MGGITTVRPVVGTVPCPPKSVVPSQRPKSNRSETCGRIHSNRKVRNGLPPPQHRRCRAKSPICSVLTTTHQRHPWPRRNCSSRKPSRPPVQVTVNSRRPSHWIRRGAGAAVAGRGNNRAHPSRSCNNNPPTDSLRRNNSRNTDSRQWYHRLPTVECRGTERRHRRPSRHHLEHLCHRHRSDTRLLPTVSSRRRRPHNKRRTRPLPPHRTLPSRPRQLPPPNNRQPP